MLDRLHREYKHSVDSNVKYTGNEIEQKQIINEENNTSIQTNLNQN